MAEKSARGRILIVEDHLEVAQVISEALNEKGYATVVSGSVAEAKGLLNAQFFDLSVVDFNLGDGTGVEVCRHIREKTSNRAMPIIMLTGQKGLEEMSEGIASGADYYLTKPMAVAELLLWVRSLLRRVHQDWDRGSTIGVPGLR